MIGRPAASALVQPSGRKPFDERSKRAPLAASHPEPEGKGAKELEQLARLGPHHEHWRSPVTPGGGELATVAGWAIDVTAATAAPPTASTMSRATPERRTQPPIWLMERLGRMKLT